jgi:histidinol-phosphate aminotransferase
MVKKRAFKTLAPYQNDRLGVNFASKDWLRLDWNESTEAQPASVTKALISSIRKGGLNFYPDAEAAQLRKALGKYVRQKPEMIIAYNGADSALKNIFDAFLNPGNTVLIFGPTYTQIHPFIAVNNAKRMYFIPENIFKPTELEIHTFLRKHKGSYGLVYINNPNNPTGTLLEPKFIKKLCHEFADTLFIIDEAYYEFSGGKTCVPLLTKYANIIVVRSFSKAFRLAGIRLGYTVAHTSINREILKVYNGKEVNLLAQVAGIAAIRDQKAVRSHVKKIQEAKKTFVKKLRKFGFEIHAGYGNFVVIRDNAYMAMKNALLKNGILIRDRSSLPKMAKCLRITISCDKRFLRTVPSVLKKARDSFAMRGR